MGFLVLVYNKTTVYKYKKRRQLWIKINEISKIYKARMGRVI